MWNLVRSRLLLSFRLWAGLPINCWKRRGKLRPGSLDYQDNLREIIARHHDIIAGVVPEERQEEVCAQTDALLDELSNIYKGVSLIRDLSAKTQNIIVSYGERLSSFIISRIIDGAVHYDSRTFIKTESQFEKNIVDFEITNALIHETFTQLPQVALVPGFISSDSRTGEVTNLGRGGSDYTAAIIAAALDASRLEIWTDVDGFMTADPRVINNYLCHRTALFYRGDGIV